MSFPDKCPDCGSKQPLGPSHPESRGVLQLAARSLCRDPRRLISRAADLSSLALRGRTMAPSLRPGASGGPLLSAEPLGPRRPVVSGRSVLPCRAWRGSCVSVWQSLPSSSAGCEPDDSERSPVTGDRKLRWKLRKLLGHTRGQRWINNDGNQTFLSIFFCVFLCLPPWRVCVCGPFLSCTSPSVRPTPSWCAFMSHECSRVRAPACAQHSQNVAEALNAARDSPRRDTVAPGNNGRCDTSH